MRRIHFSDDEVLQLKKERLEHEHPIVRRRMMALYLKAVGYRHKDICNELDISHECLRSTWIGTLMKDSMGLGALGTVADAISSKKIETVSSLILRPILLPLSKRLKPESRRLQESSDLYRKFEPF